MISKKDNLMICPDCGKENIPIGEDWLNIMSDGESVRCTKCNYPLYSSDDLETNGSTQYGFLIRFLFMGIILSGIVYFLNTNFGILNLTEDYGTLAYAIVLLLFISSTLAYGKFFQNLKYISIWFGIFIVLIIGYSYRYDLAGIKNKVLGEIIPTKGVQTTTGSISFPVSSDGHFYIRALVNGTPIIFLADTGASDIVLSPNDAEKLGYNISELNFNRYYETANGMVRGSLIKLSNFEIGHIHLSQIGVSVNEAKMTNSLLGMTFFKQMERYEVKNEMLTLSWKQKK